MGVRTLSDAVDFSASLVASDGTIRTTVTRAYPADFHEQRTLSDWFGTLAQRNDRVVVAASHHSAPSIAGGVILYLSETDNVTNDVSVFIPRQNDILLTQPIVQCSFGCSFLVR